MVGLPDGTAEHVACAVVPNLEHEPALSRGRGAGQDRGALPDRVRRAAVLEAGQDAGVLGRRPAQDRQAVDQAPRGGGRAGAAAAEAERRPGQADGRAGREGATGAGWFLDILADGDRPAAGDVHLEDAGERAGLRQPDLQRAGRGAGAGGRAGARAAGLQRRRRRRRPARAAAQAGRRPRRARASAAGASWARCWASTI